jgi:hypothetical protein
LLVLEKNNFMRQRMAVAAPVKEMTCYIASRGYWGSKKGKHLTSKNLVACWQDLSASLD